MSDPMHDVTMTLQLIAAWHGREREVVEARMLEACDTPRAAITTLYGLAASGAFFIKQHLPTAEDEMIVMDMSPHAETAPMTNALRLVVAYANDDFDMVSAMTLAVLNDPTGVALGSIVGELLNLICAHLNDEEVA